MQMVALNFCQCANLVKRLLSFVMVSDRKAALAIKKAYYQESSAVQYMGQRKLFDFFEEKYSELEVKLSQVRLFMSKQLTWKSHKPLKHIFRGLKSRAFGLDSIWQADLIEMQNFTPYNDGNRYILLAIDVLSRFIFTSPLKNKKPESVATAFANIFRKTGRKWLPTPERNLPEKPSERFQNWRCCPCYIVFKKQGSCCRACYPHGEKFTVPLLHWA